MEALARKGRELVLIADSDVERAQRLARACADRGIAVEIATHGALALEVAIAQRPVALVAQLDLPLIDGERLAEILRANPRTETLGVLFVADAKAALREGDSNSRVVPGHADPEMLVHFIEAMLTKRQSARSDDADSDDEGGIEGELTQVSLTELIELFHMNRKSGRIELERIAGRRAETGQVVLGEGDVVGAATGPVSGEKALYRLLAWDRGRFVFHPDPGPHESTIERPTRALLREGNRHVKEWKKLVPELPPANARVVLRLSRDALPNVLHPLSQELLMVLEMADEVQEIIDRCSFPDYQVLRTLITMVRRGMLEVRNDLPAGDAASASAFSATLSAQLRERIQRIAGGESERAKVVVVPANDAAAVGFAQLLSHVPGADVEVPRAPTHCVGSFGTLAVDGELGVDWICAPPSRSFAPAWPFTVHGAIAVLMLHAGPVSDSIEQLSGAVERIRSIPRGRTLHVLLQEKENGTSSADLCESVELFDAGTALEIPLAKDGNPVQSVCELLDRILA